MSGGQADEEGDGAVVVVPASPGPLLRPAPERAGARDDLDQLIDDLLPDSPEGPGGTDAALVAGGAALLAWGMVADPPMVVTVAGATALGLGCVLPMRAAWRVVADHRRDRRRSALLGRGLALRASDPDVAGLVAAYEALDGPSVPPGARAAAHGALLEVASLLGGRAPSTNRERAYVEARTAAVRDLVDALAEVGPPDPSAGGETPALAPDLVVEAREELDALGAGGSLSRLDQVTAAVRSRGRRR